MNERNRTRYLERQFSESIESWTRDCEDDWRYNPQTDKCYKFFDEEQSWPMSEIYCQFSAAHHVSIHGPHEIAFIQESWTRDCEDDWRYNPQTDKCYKFFDEEQSWPMSEIYCQFNAAHHVSIHGPHEIAFIQGEVFKSFPVLNVAIFTILASAPSVILRHW
ncbi:unnamed protein product [Gongylonema pulchrum]|uniref:C-type lectin domain-containing protein n=1 Tax=Gongylonema pulchrum TaxID=637853 RepID=A0A183EKP0_9BILA|nr:unnamed protein product [Gongylonema pulchrum]